ncbi:TRAP transporter small permease [Microbaculum marinum]|uniref:TRAP transporter small permease protein n=1 Tax=Microbaculum marinum TaxID=1764581 RepID=A0AAW9RP82_9HYPH
MSAADRDDAIDIRLLGPEPGLGWIAVALKLFIAVILLALMLLTCVDVVGRYVFNAPVPGAPELTEFGMGLLIFGALPLVTVRREHVSIELMTVLFAGRGQRLQNAVMQLTSLVALALMAWQLWERGIGLSRYSDSSIYLGLPLAPMAYFMSMMSGLAALALLVSLVWRRG